MVIDNFFILHKKPSQYIYAGENYIDIYKSSNRTFEKTKTLEGVSIYGLNTYNFSEIKRELGDTDTGIVLNSENFIFNIFDFEKIPFRENLKRDMIEWRVKKVFPENIENYEHNFFRLRKNSILSILFKKNIKEQIENLFEENDINLIYVGNSTVEIINNLKRSRPLPDFFIEIDKTLAVIVFLDNSYPFYIRKFRGDTTANIVTEISKTINFVKNSYSKATSTYSVISDQQDFAFIREGLKEINIEELSLKNRKKLILPE